MENEQQNDESQNIALTIEEYYLTLKTINNFRFTNREIDIIASLLGGKSSKKISSLLSISPKTVEIHLRNIMLRIGCNSREALIEFIEKSDKLPLIKEHYSHLLIKTTFEVELKKFLPSAKNSNLNCLLFYYKKQRSKDLLIEELEKHLTIAGIKTCSKVWEKNKAKVFLTDKITAKEINCIVYVLSNDLIEKLQTAGSNIIEEAVNSIPIINDSKTPIIFLLLNKVNVIFPELNQKSVDFACVNLTTQDNYYFLVFDLLITLLPNSNIDTTTVEFKKRYQLGNNYPFVQQDTEGAERNTKRGGITHIFSKRNLFLKWGNIIFFPLLLVFGLFIFVSNITTKNISSKQDISIKSQKNTVLFNFPPRNSTFTGRKIILTKIKNQLNKQKFGVIIQTIVGLGGVGKTQLVAEFAYLSAEKNNYGAILWINAETPDAINQTYNKLATFLQIDTRGLSPKQIRTFIHRELIKKYKNSKLLFILDNVPNYDNIQGYIRELHEQLLTSFTMHVLITSRNQSWPNRPLLLNTFTSQEALMFIRKQLPEEKNGPITELAGTMHYFPLALNQATAYIKSHTNIADYLTLYASKPKDYLNKCAENNNQYFESLWKTWDIALTKLSKPAKDIIFTASYLYPDDIPFALFDNLSIEERGNAIAELRKHSLITIIDANAFKMHRLLQEVIRITSANLAIGDLNGLSRAISLLKNKFNFSYANHASWNLCRQYLTHTQTVAEYAMITNSRLFNDGIQLYAQVAMYLTYVQEEHQNAIAIWNKMLLLIQQHFGNDNASMFATANIKTQLGLVLLQIGEIPQAKKCLKKAMLIYQTKPKLLPAVIEKLLVNLRWNSNITASDGIKCDQSFVLMVWGLIKQELSNFKAAEKAYNQALTILDTCKNSSKNVVLYKIALLQSLGDLYNYCGNTSKSLQVLTTAKILADKNFPNNLEQAYVYENFAYLLYYTGKYDEAKLILNKCLKIRLDSLAKVHYRIGVVKAILGIILATSNKTEEGLAKLKQAEVIYAKNFGPEHICFAYLYPYIYYALEKHQEYNQALQYLTKARNLALKHWGHRTCIALANYLTPIEELPTLSATVKNADYFQQALTITQELFGNEHIITARYHYLLGQFFEKQLNINKAKQHYQATLSITTKQHFDDDSLTLGNQQNIKLIQAQLEKLNK